LNSWSFFWKFQVFAILFWLAEFFYQYWVLVPGNFVGSLVRGSALAGAMLIGFALASSVIFRWVPRTAQYWRLRRYFGVSGFVFVFLHALFVYYFYFAFDFAEIYFTLNPLKNPVVFGSIALPIFMVMALTSTDWAVRKLTPRVWKFVHRFVYVAYLASVFHFITINPELLANPAGYILLAVTLFVLFDHTQLFLKTAIKKRFRSLGTFVGFAIIAATLALAYAVWSY